MVTVLVPTHDNGATLRVSVASALAQTHDALEVMIVGDGISEAGREAAAELAASDRRVSFLDFEKGERHGEANRGRALQEARGEHVLYLSDDDIWFPRHVEEVTALLSQGAGFVGATVAAVDPGEGLRPLPHDLARGAWRRLMADGQNRMPLTGAAHTMAAYRASPGWRPAPPEIATDLHFYRWFLRSPEVAVASSRPVSALHFASRARRDMTRAERLAELEEWWGRVSDPAGLELVEREIAAAWQELAIRLDFHRRRRRLDEQAG